MRHIYNLEPDGHVAHTVDGEMDSLGLALRPRKTDPAV